MYKKSMIITVGIIIATIANYIWVFALTPLEVNQGYVQKIMYLHVPAILSSYIVIFLLGIGSLGYLQTNKKSYDFLNIASAELTVILLLISLLTGSIWGKATWNTYWTWDARLTITLISFIYFCAYLLYRYLAGHSSYSAKGAAVVAIIGFASIPINHLAVQWFNSIHQGSTIFLREPKIDAPLLYPLISSIFIFLLITACCLYWRITLEREKQKYFEININ